ncbi:MAG TPA: hypothetical protein VF217_11395 [Rhodanobacteraceae bacterium]
MAETSFDRFLDGLYGALVRAQAAGRRRREQSLKQQFGGVGDGDTAFAIPTLRPDGWRTEHVPLLDLLEPREIGISQLIVEIACELRVKRTGPLGRDARVVIEVCNGSHAASARHRLRVHLRGVDLPQGDVFIDGRLLRRVDGTRQPVDPLPTKGRAPR